jgi:hypothetical protein
MASLLRGCRPGAPTVFEDLALGAARSSRRAAPRFGERRKPRAVVNIAQEWCRNERTAEHVVFADRKNRAPHIPGEGASVMAAQS